MKVTKEEPPNGRFFAVKAANIAIPSEWTRPLMTDYIARFNEARAWTDFRYGGMSNYPLQIDPSVQIDVQTLVAAIASDFQQFIDSTDDLPGRCFLIARELSYIIGGLNIRHTVTVGDIRLKDGFYVNLSRERLVSDLDGGYQVDMFNGIPVGKPIDAHCWITLENGQIIDGTILASQHRKAPAGANPLSFEDAIYYTGKEGAPELEFIPMTTGFVYLQRVLTSPQDGDFSTYLKWYKDFHQMMCAIDLERLVPELQRV